jgi:uncharacterized membrane protein YgcG
MLRRLLSLLLLVGAAAVSVVSAAAQRSIEIQEFAADLFVRLDGEVLVTEQIQLRFRGSWNGFVRTIPVRYRTPEGFGFRLRMDVESITDGAGNALRYESSREGDSRALKIWVPDAENATRGVVIRYRVANALQFFREGDPAGARDELYWNITGNEWEMPIRRSVARVHLPEGVAGLKAVAFTGGWGSTEQAAKIDISERMVVAQATRAFAPGEGLTLAVAWETGVVARPTAVNTIGDFLRANWLLGVPVLVLFGMFWQWRRVGRDPDAGPTMVRYEPPEKMTPAELGTLVDHSADMSDITATLVDLAVRGYLQIEETSQSRMLGLKTETEYTFHRSRPPAEWESLEAHERALLLAFFGGGAVIPFKGIAGLPLDPRQQKVIDRVVQATGGTSGEIGRAVQQAMASAEQRATALADPANLRTSVTLSSLQNSFYMNLETIRTAIYQRLVARGYYLRRPDHVKGIYMGGTFALGVAVLLLGIFAGEAIGIEPLTAVIAGVLTGIIGMSFGYFMPARTRSGADALSAALGFKEFLYRVESDRYRRMIQSPEQFEQFLPHAMALGVEEKWAAAFEDLYRQPPQWYRGGDPAAFRTRSFVRQLNTMSTRTISTMQSQPSKSRSSGGSGFRGGSSGGGRGGGGGRGF